MKPIRTDGSNQFAHYTVRVRLPGMVDDVMRSHPELPARQAEALADLRDELVNDAPLALFGPPSPDHDEWAAFLDEHERRLAPGSASWQNAEWFLAEHFFFRRILAAVRYFETATDPFGAAKRAERESERLARQLDALLAERAVDDRLVETMRFALWGNRIDLSHGASVAIGESSPAHEHDVLIADDSEEALARLQGARGAVHIICDNAGTELAGDLCLADWLCTHGAGPVWLHVKALPTFVSDATAGDVRALISSLLSASSSAARRAFGARLEGAFREECLRIWPDPFWNSPLFLDALPPRLQEPLAAADLIIIKGDMNYRRLLRDTVVPATDPLARWATPLPAPVLLLRTMKGDPVAGLQAGRVERLDREEPGWRTAGKHGVIQVL